jgi:hypothetical protein
MRSGRTRPDTWRLRPGDLPSRRVLRAEPRLRGLPDNAVFRLIVHRRRLVGPELYVQLLIMIGVVNLLLGGALILMPGGERGVVFIHAAAVLHLFFLGHGLWQLRYGARSVYTYPIASRFLQDFVMAGISSSEIAVGIWGALLSRERLRIQLVWCAIYVAAVIGGVFIMADRLPLVWVLGLGPVAYYAALIGCAPVHVLPGLHGAMRAYRERMRPDRKRRSPAAPWALAAGSYLGYMAVLYVIVIVARVMTDIDPPAGVTGEAAIRHTLGTGAGLMIGGALLAAFRGFQDQRRADKDLVRTSVVLHDFLRWSSPEADLEYRRDLWHNRPRIRRPGDLMGR